MPLNKLENFIKNTEGRILYVNPNDIDSTDAITNQGNSLAAPFKTIQRALLESARFSYLRGSNNDLIERTTILVYPGEHEIDNRPGFAIKDVSGTATAVSPSGAETAAQTTLALDLTSNFDITQEDNILYKFNSINGGVIVPRGTSIVGLDLRKTKIKPKYVPNPTDTTVASTAIFRVTGTCYFWQFSIFDGDEAGLVYTDPIDFSANNQSTPSFSHHKLTCFEYADGVNVDNRFSLTDLEIYYAKLSNGFNLSSTRDIDQKYPASTDGFAPQRPEFEIVGAFASDPLSISSLICGDGATPGNVVTVTTSTPHGLSSGTPIKLKNVSTPDYNISTKVASVLTSTQFTYLLPFVRPNLKATPDSVASATITIETDTVSGASPYIFNVSLRSVFGMNGILADGAKATGFRSIVVAQFTGISLQKDDRAFVKYNETSRAYEGITIQLSKGASLSKESSSLDPSTVYHLDSDAIYRREWQTAHINMKNDAIMQIVSVFAIGFNKHFNAETGSDASVTNSNSNFGQIALTSDGFKKSAFTKDDTAYISNIITPRSINETPVNVDWQSLDVGLTTSVGISSHLYLYAFKDFDDKPPVIIQGYRVGAKSDDVLSLNAGGSVKTAEINMTDSVVSTGSSVISGTNVSIKVFRVQSGPSFIQNDTGNSNIFTIGTHTLRTGEKVRVFSDDGDLPENIESNTVYFVIRISSTEIKLASSVTNAQNNVAITVYGGTKLFVESRVSDKSSGDIGSPVQFDPINKSWFIHVNTDNTIYPELLSQGITGLTEKTIVTTISRTVDPRSLDERLYTVRVVVPKEAANAKDPDDGFVIQESSTSGARASTDFSLRTIDASDVFFNRNPRFISTCSASASTVSVRTELPHNLNVSDKVNIVNVKSTTNTTGVANSAYNGTFEITAITNDKEFQYTTTDTDGKVHTTGDFTSDTSDRTVNLPRFQRNDLQSNLYIYRSEVISQYIKDVQDGVYHLYVLKADNTINTEFTDQKYSQNVTDLYPQQDKDNENDNPPASVSFARRTPIGDVVTNSLKNSITREATDKLIQDFGKGLKITSIDSTTGVSTLTFDREHGLSGIVTYSDFTGGTGYTDGTYHNIKLFNSGTSTWDGATGKVTISGGSIIKFDVTDGGSGYLGPEKVEFDPQFIGSPSIGAAATFTTAGISTNVGDVLQITGIGTLTDGYFRISSVPSTRSVAIAKTGGDTSFLAGQYALNLGPAVSIVSDDFESVSGVSTFTCSSAHGLVIGSPFRIIDSSNNKLGDFTVKERVGIKTFSAKTDANLNGAFVLPHGMSAADATSGPDGENIGTRGLSFFDNETLTLTEDLTTGSQMKVVVPNAGIGTALRFPLGSYVQIDNEIMRVTTSELSGSGLDVIGVVRGALGSPKEDHLSGSLIKKITPIPIEFRRPSIIRASGHTFEYIGYGPGNYSTGLPQVQVKTLTEREEFLVQSQERSCGQVVYTGMNNEGDFFIGNKRVSSSTGQEKTFDAPVPTVTGEDPSRLSVVFDEVVIKERLKVEGGTSRTILSNFDGPVNFSKDVRFDALTNISKTLTLSQGTQALSVSSGDLVVSGGVGIGKSVYIGGDLNVAGTVLGGNLQFGNIRIAEVDDNTIDTTTGPLMLNSVSGITSVRDNLQVDNNLTVDGNATLGNATSDATTVSGTLAVQSTTDSSSKTTGAVVVSGGVGIGKELHVGGDITAFASSDINLKENINVIPNALDKVNAISGNTFTWKSGKGDDTGVIAQEIEALGLPGVTTTREDGTKAVRYERLVPLLIQAIKELEARVKTLESS
jgi:hypothetical protein